jgi:hypothetical protein
MRSAMALVQLKAEQKKQDEPRLDRVFHDV